MVLWYYGNVVFPISSGSSLRYDVVMWFEAFRFQFTVHRLQLSDSTTSRLHNFTILQLHILIHKIKKTGNDHSDRPGAFVISFCSAAASFSGKV